MAEPHPGANGYTSRYARWAERRDAFQHIEDDAAEDDGEEAEWVEVDV